MTEKTPFETWQEKVYEPATSRFPERKEQFKSSSDIPIPAVVPPENINPNQFDELGLPATYPYTRGVQPTMYRGRLWTICRFFKRGGIEQALPLPPGPGADGSERRF